MFEKNKIKDVMLITLVTLLLFLCLEVFIRLFYPEVVTRGEQRIWEYNPNVLGVFQPNTSTIQGRWIGLPYLVTTNNEGLRYPRNITRKKPDNTCRILAVGDSTTQCVHVDDKDAYPLQLERRLKDLSPNFKVEVLNAGRGKYSIQDELVYLEDKGLKLNPDIVILGFFINDFDDLVPYVSLDETRANMRKGYPQWMYKTGITAMALEMQKRLILKVMALYKKTTPDSHEKGALKKDYKREKAIYLKLLTQFVNDVRSEGKKLVFLLIPSYYQYVSGASDEIRHEILKIAREARVRYICDLHPKLKPFDPKYLYLIPENKHFSRFGNIKISEVLAEYLKNEGLLKDWVQRNGN